MNSFGKTAGKFMAIGAVLYLLVYAASEWQLYRTGDTNPFYKIATTKGADFNWVVLGASHAMPLDFAGFQESMGRNTGLEIINLSAPGAGPLYNRFVLEQFVAEHHARNLLYVLDSFAFYSPDWNEGRFADSGLLRRTPFSPAVAWRLVGYCIGDGVDPRAPLDYLTGFSKINNVERFERDVWEGEAQFERVYRPSAAATAKRVAYLYPGGAPDADILDRYLGAFADLLDLAAQKGIGVTIIKMPMPSRFRDALPSEAAFDEAVSRRLASSPIRYQDFSAVMDDPQFYFDTDHLNRAGVEAFFERHLKGILVAPGEEEGTR